MEVQKNNCNCVYYEEKINFFEKRIDDIFYNLSELLMKRCDIIEANLLTKMNDIIESLNNQSKEAKFLLKKELFKLNERYEIIFSNKNKLEEIEKNILANSIMLNQILIDYTQDNHENNKSNKISGCIF